MNRELLEENHSRIVFALVALAVMLALGLSCAGLFRLFRSQNDRSAAAVLDTLRYTEDAAETELATLQALSAKQPLSTPVRGALYQAMAEISYMTGDDMLYNQYVASALFYQQRAGESAAVVYLTNNYIGRLYANGCYASAASVLQQLAQQNDINALPLEQQADYYLSCADVAEMLEQNPAEPLSRAQAALQLMPEDSARQLNQAKLDLLTVRSRMQSGDWEAAAALLGKYDETDNFGFGAGQVYVVCDYLIPYYELRAKLALAQEKYSEAYHYVDLYLDTCSVYQFRTMKLRLLQYVVAHTEARSGTEREKYSALEKMVSQQNLAEMTNEYGQFLLADLNATTDVLTRQERTRTLTLHRILYAAVMLYAFVLLGCIVSVFLDYVNRDGLTKLNNRRKYENIRNRCESRRIPYCLLMFDIDDFKKVNDTFGHDRGDEVLRTISALLRRYSGRGISAYRYGGEELCMMLVRVPEKRAREIAEEIRAAVESTFADTPLHATISGGVSVSRAGENVFRAADQKLYEAKRSGKNRIC